MASWLSTIKPTRRLTLPVSRSTAASSPAGACRMVGPKTVARLAIDILLSTSCRDTRLRKGKRTARTSVCSLGRWFLINSRMATIRWYSAGTSATLIHAGYSLSVIRGSCSSRMYCFRQLATAWASTSFMSSGFFPALYASLRASTSGAAPDTRKIPSALHRSSDSSHGSAVRIIRGRLSPVASLSATRLTPKHGVATGALSGGGGAGIAGRGLAARDRSGVDTAGGDSGATLASAARASAGCGGALRVGRRFAVRADGGSNRLLLGLTHASSSSRLTSLFPTFGGGSPGSCSPLRIALNRARSAARLEAMRERWARTSVRTVPTASSAPSRLDTVFIPFSASVQIEENLSCA
mmetsp:Transcript_15522/g.40204  ORF Transcript_15522/g.40204 Transcript_15522/m.40204 type:complete len:353 (-) Transcript_15522:1051-2109(-)